MVVKDIVKYMETHDVCKVSASHNAASMKFQDRVRAGFNEDRFVILYDDYCDMYVVPNNVIDFGE